MNKKGRPDQLAIASSGTPAKFKERQSRVLSAFIGVPCSVSGAMCLWALPCKRAPLFPRGPRSEPSYAVPVHLHLIGPSAPLPGTSWFRRLAAYTWCPRCAFPPRRPATGSALSLCIPFPMPPPMTAGSSSAALAQFLHRRLWPSPRVVGYDYGGNWALPPMGLSPTGTSASIAAQTLPSAHWIDPMGRARSPQYLYPTLLMIQIRPIRAIAMHQLRS